MNSSRKQVINRIRRRLRNEEGNVLITAFIFLVILTLIGIFATRTAQMDIQIAANEIPYKQNFYIAEAGLYREAAELGRGTYAITDINPPDPDDPPLATHESAVLPGADHTVFDQPYDFEVRYLGFFLPPKGYDASGNYARYDFTVDVTANNVRVASRLYKIGLKPE